MFSSCFDFIFCFNDTATTEIYTLSLHDALPICFEASGGLHLAGGFQSDPAQPLAMPSFAPPANRASRVWLDRKSTRLNSHANISYAVFCLKKKKNNGNEIIQDTIIEII